MEFNFAISGDQAISAEGEITDYSISSSPGEISTLILTIKATTWKLLPSWADNQTMIVVLPHLAEALRVWGSMSFTLKGASPSDMALLVVELGIKGIYKNYDEACAAEMQDKMEQSK